MSRSLPELLAEHRKETELEVPGVPVQYVLVKSEVMTAYIAAVEAFDKVAHFNFVGETVDDYDHDDDCPVCIARDRLTEVLTAKFGGGE